MFVTAAPRQPHPAPVPPDATSRSKQGCSTRSPGSEPVRFVLPAARVCGCFARRLVIGQPPGGPCRAEDVCAFSSERHASGKPDASEGGGDGHDYDDDAEGRRLDQP
ncbi:unnamed protein product [Prorocentrum cordatum]|uniref:Uncharacterized protein n=1 Tax=Prorocentrum cordatum TaxID=2364126 RepID=A0ABN9Y2E4_9DINO|nr:unnamed protein product [Polarella glacialis]